MCSTHPVHLILALITLLIFGKEHISLSFWLCNFLQIHVTSNILNPNTFLNILPLNSFSLSSISVKVTHIINFYTNSVSNPREYLVICFYSFTYRVRSLRDIKPKTSLANHSQSIFQAPCVNCRTETHCAYNHLNTSYLISCYVIPTAESKLSNRAFGASVVPHTDHSKCSVCCDDVA